MHIEHVALSQPTTQSHQLASQPAYWSTNRAASNCSSSHSIKSLHQLTPSSPHTHRTTPLLPQHVHERCHQVLTPRVVVHCHPACLHRGSILYDWRAHNLHPEHLIKSSSTETAQRMVIIPPHSEHRYAHSLHQGYLIIAEKVCRPTTAVRKFCCVRVLQD